MKALFVLPALAVLAMAASAPAAPAPKAAQTQTKMQITDPTPPVQIPEADPAAEFLAANAKAPGVITLPSGLQYKVVTKGDAKIASPKVEDYIKVNYEGKLLDGTVFDSSFARGKASIMPLGNLIPAWKEVLPLMHVGEEIVLYVPPALGYGPEGRGPIPPNSVMVFRLQLLGQLSAD